MTELPHTIADGPVDGARRGVSGKFHAPRLRSDQLWRTEVVDRLSNADEALLAVHAGAGYGKTTAVRQWIEVDPREAAWVTVDEHDDDPVVLLGHVVTALDGIPSMREVETALSQRFPSILGVIVPMLGQILWSLPEPIILVLDDIHLVTNPESVTLLEWLADSMPDGSTLVLCGRSVPTVNLAKRKMSEDALEIGRDQLKFTVAESRELIERSLPGLEGPDVTSLIDLTEGWPAGLYLCLLLLRSSEEPSAVVADLPRQLRRLDAYFHEQVLQSFREESRTFLLRTSVLDRLNGSLCDEMLDGSGSGTLLEQLADSDNLFVVGLDDESEWFRYHHLFSDLLLAELRAGMPEEEVVLRHRAARWLSRHGQIEAAVGQAIATGDVPFAADTIYEHLVVVILSGRIATLHRWLESFTPGQRRSEPLLAVASAWLALLEGHADEVEHWLRVTNACEPPRVLPDGAPSFEVARAALAMMWGRDGLSAMLHNGELVAAAGPTGNPWWGTACMLVATCRRFADRHADAVVLMGESELATRGDASAHAVALGHLALVYFENGDDELAQHLARRATDELRASGLDDFGLTVEVHAVEAFAAARRGALAESTLASGRAMHLLTSATPQYFGGSYVARLVLADAALLRGEVSAAANLLERSAEQLRDLPEAVVLHDWADRIGEQVSRRQRKTSEIDSFGITPAEMRVLALLPTHLRLEDIGAELFVSRNTVKTHAVSIYRRLGVSGRRAAVERARALDLLESGPPAEGTTRAFR